MSKSHNDAPETTRAGFGFSTNRGQARHRVRYVEGTLSSQGECRLCREEPVSPRDQQRQDSDT